ncbi:MAG: hypothetical protein K2Y18_03615 [Alphaproteobacteria bacterium]|jgi:hypothetical protein|nr:hypothetical protein [Alphaproteobacteria bacterium]
MNSLTLYLLISITLVAAGLYLYYAYYKAAKRESLGAELHQTSCVMQRNLQGDIKRKRQEYMGYLIESLTLLKKSYSDPKVSLTDTDRLDILELCLRQAKPLFMGLWEPTNKEEVDLKVILLNIPLLFAEKIHILNLDVEIDIPETPTILLGEPVFVEVLLISLIGKIIYRIPNRGKLVVSLEEEDGDFHIEIWDNGYVLTGSAANLIIHLHDFFIEDSAFQQLCLDNGIGYSTSYEKDDNKNMTYLMFPAPEEEIANSNVEKIQD